MLPPSAWAITDHLMTGPTSPRRTPTDPPQRRFRRGRRTARS